MSLLAKPGLAHFRSVPSSANPDQATAETIRIMCGHIKDATGDPLVKRSAEDAVRRWRGGPAPSSDPAIYAACSDFWWARHAVKYVHHEELIRAWLGEADQLQLLIPPDALLRMRTPEGDCAVYTMLLCAMLETHGVPWEIVTVATNPAEPAVFSHVYPRAICSGLRVSLDAIPSAGGYPGWQVPSVHVSRLQVWNQDGQPAADEDRTRYRGLGMYTRRKRRGVGDVTDDLSGASSYFDSLFAGGAPSGGSSFSDLFSNITSDPFSFSNAGADVSEGGLYQPPSGSPSFSTPGAPSPWAGLVASLANQWTKIGGNVIAPQTVLTRGANGQMYYSSPGGSSGASLLTTGALGTASSSSLLLIGGLLVGGVLLMKALGK